jgi:hypothetical protein
VGFVVDKVALGQVFLRVLEFPLPIFISPTSPQSPSPIMRGWYNSHIYIRNDYKQEHSTCVDNLNRRVEDLSYSALSQKQRSLLVEFWLRDVVFNQTKASVNCVASEKGVLLHRRILNVIPPNILT